MQRLPCWIGMMWMTLGAALALPLSAARAQDKPAEKPAPAQPAPAQPAPASAPAAQPPAEQPASAPAAPGEASDKAIRSTVEDYWFYGKIGKFDLAVASAQKLLAMNPDPVKVMDAFEAVAADRRYSEPGKPDNVEEWLDKWQRVDAMRDVTTKIMQVLTAGSLARKSDPQFIKENIERLAVNQRAYARGLASLRQSGELAVPIMIDYLRDPT